MENSIKDLLLKYFECQPGIPKAIFEIELRVYGEKVITTQITVKRRLNYLVKEGKLMVRRRKNANYNEWIFPLDNGINPNQEELFQ